VVSVSYVLDLLTVSKDAGRVLSLQARASKALSTWFSEARAVQLFRLILVDGMS